MQVFRKLAAVFLMAAIASSAYAVVMPTETVGASAACNERFLTFPAWYNNALNDSCEFDISNNATNNDLIKKILPVGFNIVEIVLQLVAYATVVMLIKGGFDYMLSSGDSNKMSSAKNTIQNALIGLVISIMAVAIVNVAAGAV